MAKLIILVGLPGSGKSWYAENMLWPIEAAFSESDVVIHSSDAIRGELFGDEGSQENNALVFETMHRRVKEDLRAGKTVIYDATNITRKARRGAINLASKDDTVYCHIVWAEPSVCIERAASRSRVVGEDVIFKMMHRWQSPHMSEGFDDMKVICADPNFDQVRYVAMSTMNMQLPHDNPHHTSDIWGHCQFAWHYLQTQPKKNSAELIAAMWHDIGKPYTKSWHVDKETGKIDYNHAHYYDHHCVGGYLAYGLFLHNTEYDSDMICWISWLICNHMEPFFNSHYYQDLPTDMKDALDRIHAADLAAH